MAAKYRKIDPRIWDDEKFERLPVMEKLIALYCLTAQVNRVGLFRFSVALASEQTGIAAIRYREGMLRVCHTLNWRFDEGSKTLYFPTWWKYNAPDNEKHLKGCLEDLHDLPQTPLLQDFAQNTRYLPDTLCHTFHEGIAYRMPYQEQEQEQEQECVDALATEAPQVVTQPTRKTFQPPTPEEAVAYGQTIGLTAEQCRAWMDHFEANGWRVGGKAPMRSWQASLRTWKRNEGTFGQVARNGKPAGPKASAEGYSKMRQMSAERDAAVAARIYHRRQDAPAPLADLLGDVAKEVKL